MEWVKQRGTRRSRRRHYADYEDVLDALKSNLADLGAHIVAHNHVVDAAQTDEEIKTAIAKFDAWRDYDPPPRPSQNLHPCRCIVDDAEWAKVVHDAEDRLYKEAFDYLRDHMRSWWD